MKNYKISIIMTVYNKEKHLETSIQSILNQTYSNLELIIVEDCSLDSSKKILKKYEDNCKIKIIYNKENLGCYASRNVALNIASGDIIGFQDADDYSVKRRIEKQVKKMQKYNLLLCGCNIVRSNFDKIIIDNEKKLISDIKKENIKQYFGYATMLIHRSIFEKYGNFIERRKGMDMEYGERILFHECNIFFDNKDSWSYFNGESNKIYKKINRLLYICPKMDNNNITKCIKDDLFLKNKMWRSSYKKIN